MAHVTPLLATYRAQIFYHVDGLSHVTQVLCSADPSSTPSGYGMRTFSLATLDADAAVQAYATLFKALLPASNATIDTWQLEKFDAGAYVPVYANSIGAVGTSGSARSRYSRATAVFRSLGGEKVRNVMMGIGAPAPDHAAIAASSGAALAFWGDFVVNTAGHIGDWACGRDNEPLKTALFYTISLDRKSRRRAGNL